MVTLARPWRLVLLAACALGPLLGPAPAAAPHPGDEDVRQKLQDIFEREEFGPGKARGPTWLERQFRALFKWLGSLRETAPALFWLLTGLCVAVLAGLALLVAAQLRRLFFTTDDPGEERARAAQRAELSRAYRDEARERASRREFTDAIRFLFLSLVFLFDESGRVLFPRAYTNREYLRLFDDRPQVESDLRVFVDALDEHWYGLRPAAEEQYRACLQRYEHLAGRGA